MKLSTFLLASLLTVISCSENGESFKTKGNHLDDAERYAIQHYYGVREMGIGRDMDNDGKQDYFMITTGGLEFYSPNAFKEKKVRKWERLN